MIKHSESGNLEEINTCFLLPRTLADLACLLPNTCLPFFLLTLLWFCVKGQQTPSRQDAHSLCLSNREEWPSDIILVNETQVKYDGTSDTTFALII